MKGYPEAVSRLIDAFARLPGIGRRSAERLAFHVLREGNDEAIALAHAITDAKTKVSHCPICWNISDQGRCAICSDTSREASIVLVVEQPKDVLAIEKTRSFRGIYHVLLGRLDPLAGVGPEGIVLEPLLARIDDATKNAQSVVVEELVLGMNPDLEGDTTALWIAREASKRGVRVTRLARGLASGSQLDLANPGVIADAIAGRTGV
ncbi:MAG: recombination protein RecR [Phycisphaerales bacterium]|nr:recombination protein RecR [Phycisphaerales bacterium]